MVKKDKSSIKSMDLDKKVEIRAKNMRRRATVNAQDSRLKVE